MFSELYGSTVVLRQLKSSQAKRRGRRALEVVFSLILSYCFNAVEYVRNGLVQLELVVWFQVLKKLARRQVMYHSYALQVHGYIAPGNAVEQEDVPLVLVHGVSAFLLLAQADLAALKCSTVTFRFQFWFSLQFAVIFMSAHGFLGVCRCT